MLHQWLTHKPMVKLRGQTKNCSTVWNLGSEFHVWELQEHRLKSYHQWCGVSILHQTDQQSKHRSSWCMVQKLSYQATLFMTRPRWSWERADPARCSWFAWGGKRAGLRKICNLSARFKTLSCTPGQDQNFLGGRFSLVMDTTQSWDAQAHTSMGRTFCCQQEIAQWCILLGRCTRGAWVENWFRSYY